MPKTLEKREDGRVYYATQWLREGNDIKCLYCNEGAKLRVDRKKAQQKLFSDTCGGAKCLSQHKTNTVRRLRAEGRIKPFGSYNKY